MKKSSSLVVLSAFFVFVLTWHASHAAFACTDSDGGRNYFMKGVAISNGISQQDVCLDEFTLVEKYCSGSEISWEHYKCPIGCSDGACISQGSSVTGNAIGITGMQIAQTISISGTVSGTGASGVTVTATHGTSYGSCWWGPAPYGSATTDANGHYTISGFYNVQRSASNPPQSSDCVYNVITASKSGCTFSPAELRSIGTGADLTNQNFVATTCNAVPVAPQTIQYTRAPPSSSLNPFKAGNSTTTTLVMSPWASFQGKDWTLKSKTSISGGTPTINPDFTAGWNDISAQRLCDATGRCTITGAWTAGQFNCGGVSTSAVRTVEEWVVVNGVESNHIYYYYKCSDAPQATCSDGIQNQGETGIDCGGPCPACQPSQTTITISGYVRASGSPVSGVSVASMGVTSTGYCPVGPPAQGSSITNSQGFYSYTFPMISANAYCNYVNTTPSKSGCTFSPANNLRQFASANINQDFAATCGPTTTCTDSLSCAAQMKCVSGACVPVGCIGEGQTGPSSGINPAYLSHLPNQCCAGLTPISYSGLYNSSCGLLSIAGAPSMACTKCGDGVCGSGETNCNCPQDCINAATCTDSDGGKNYNTKGTAQDSQTNGLFTDNCDSNLRSRLYEFYCNSNDNLVHQETHDCPNGCYDGFCLPTQVCAEGNKCTITEGQTAIITSSLGNYTVRNVGVSSSTVAVISVNGINKEMFKGNTSQITGVYIYLSDIFTFAPNVNQPRALTLTLYTTQPSCTDECSYDFQYECLGGPTFRVCGYYDGDSCLEWQIDNCSAGYVCANNFSCVPANPQTCTEGQLRCNTFFGSQIQKCKNGAWVYNDTCQYRCNETILACNPSPTSSCNSYTISPVSNSVGSSAGAGSIDVGTIPGNCDWTAVSDSAWLTISSGASGTGHGTVNYGYDPNTGAAPRLGKITIGDREFSLNQGGTICTTDAECGSGEFCYAGSCSSCTSECMNDDGSVIDCGKSRCGGHCGKNTFKCDDTNTKHILKCVNDRWQLNRICIKSGEVCGLVGGSYDCTTASAPSPAPPAPNAPAPGTSGQGGGVLTQATPTGLWYCDLPIINLVPRLMRACGV